jgi:hypothetical protein
MTTTDIKPFIRNYRPLAQMLDSDLARWVDMYKNRSERDPESFAAISTLLTEFQQFANDYVDHLSKLLERKLQSSPPPKDPETLKGAFRYELTQRLVDEWIAISAVVEQRELERYHNWLTKLDAMTRGFIPQSTGMIAYLGPSTTLRHMPYSRISIASIPRETYPDLEESRIALAHEIGHHIWRITFFDALDSERFQRRRLSEYVRENAFPQQPAIGELMAPWLEEMFADVFGAVRFGEKFAASMITSLKERTRGRDDLLRNDGVHPLPYLRPILRIRALQLANRVDRKTDDLLQDWRTHCGKYLPDKNRTLGFTTLLEANYEIPITLLPRQSAIQSMSKKMFLPDDVVIQEVGAHTHKRIFHEASLDDIEKAVDNVIENVMLPLVQAADIMEVDYSKRFTLDWLITQYLPRVNLTSKINLGEFVVLLNPLSTLLGGLEEGPGPNGIFVTHDHDGKRHTHNPDNTITTA